MGNYIKNYVWEFIACVFMCAMLIINMAQGFYIPDALADSIVIAFASSAVLLILCYVFSYNKILIIAGTALLIIAAACAFFLMAIADVDIVDKKTSNTAYIIYWFIAVIVCIAVYLATRFRIGTIIIFIAGIVANALMEYLGFESRVWTSVLFAAAAIIMFLLRQYRYTAMHSSTAEPHFGRFAVIIAVFMLISALLGGGIYYAVIKPLDPPTATVKLFEHYEIYDVLKMLGVTKNYKINNPDQSYNNQNQQEEENDETEEETEDENNDGSGEGNGESSRGIIASGIELLRTLSLNTTTLEKILIVLGLIILLFVLPPLIKFWLRRRRMKKFSEMEPRQQMIVLYAFYLKKFKTLGFRKNKWETPNEFAQRAGNMNLDRYLTGTCGMDELTECFDLARYAECSPDNDALNRVREIYPQLLKNTKSLLGIRYIFKYYVL